MLHLLGDHVNFWKNPIATDLPILERGFAACVRGGDHIYSNYIGFQAPWHLYESGAALDDVWKLTLKYEAFAVETRYAPVRYTIRIEQQFIRALKGQTRSPTSFSDDGFDEVEALEAIVKSGFGCGIVYFHIMKLVVSFTYGDYPQAWQAAERALAHLGSAFSMPIYVAFTLYQGLTSAALGRNGDPRERERHLEVLRKNHETMTGWARGSADNFADKQALLGAELAALEGDTAGAMRLYEQARLSARAQGFLQYEALACERAAALYASAGVQSLADALLSDAYALHRRWGAMGKAEHLRARHVGIVPLSPFAGDVAGTTSANSTTSATARHLDVLSVVKAAQSLSAEIVLSRLLERLMTIVGEYAGAERGSLILLEGERLVVAARADLDQGGEPTPANPARAVPQAVIQYVQRTGEPVLVENAAAHNPFARDPYFSVGVHRSVLCKPIARQGRLVGMFYLENSLVAGAFNPDRLSILEVLASQTAISIENSRLYAASQAAVLARDEFLSIASHELKTPLTPLTLQIQSLTNLIRKGTLRTTPDERLLKIASSCDTQLTRLGRLIEALLDVSRMSAGTFELHREPTDLGEVVREVIALHADDIAAAGCRVDVTAAPGVVGRWDRARLALVVTKLLLNAVKFGKGEPVAVSVSKSGDRARLLVSDRGIGVSPEDQARIFLRFERIQSRTNVDGIGLGLFIVRALVDAHGGEVRVESRTERGATFRVELPINAANAPGDTRTNEVELS